MSHMPLFKGGAVHACRKPHVTQWEAPTYILNEHKASRVPRYCIIKCGSVRVGPFKAMGKQFIGPSRKAMGTVLILVAQTSGNGSLTDSICPTLSFLKILLFTYQLKSVPSTLPRILHIRC